MSRSLRDLLDDAVTPPTGEPDLDQLWRRGRRRRTRRRVGQASLVVVLVAVVVTAAALLSGRDGRTIEFTDDLDVPAIDLLPAEPLHDAPATTPDPAPDQQVGEAGPVGPEIADTVVSRPGFPPFGEPAGVVESRIGEVTAGLVFPNDASQSPRPYIIGDDASIDTGVGRGLSDELLVAGTSVKRSRGGVDPGLMQLYGGWADASVDTVAVAHDGEWLVADTVAIPGVTARGWTVAVAGSLESDPPFADGFAAYADGRVLAASPAHLLLLAPRLQPRGGGWDTADVGFRVVPMEAARQLTDDGEGSQQALDTPVALRGQGWTSEFIGDQRRPRVSVRMLAEGEELADSGGIVTDDQPVQDAPVTAVWAVSDGPDIEMFAAGYAAADITTVRLVFGDGAWIDVPTRDFADSQDRIWAVFATRDAVDGPRQLAYWLGLDADGTVVAAEVQSRSAPAE